MAILAYPPSLRNRFLVDISKARRRFPASRILLGRFKFEYWMLLYMHIADERARVAAVHQAARFADVHLCLHYTDEETAELDRLLCKKMTSIALYFNNESYIADGPFWDRLIFATDNTVVAAERPRDYLKWLRGDAIERYLGKPIY